MDDYDYAGLIKSLREYAERHCPLDNSAGICGCIDAREVADAMQALLDSVEAYKSQTNMVLEETGGRMVIKFEPRWIPVTERLPEKRKAHYLCFLDDDSVAVCYWSNITLKGSTKWEWHNPNWKEVTHWQPLPEPPKEDKADG